MIDGVGSIKVHLDYYNFGITFILATLKDEIKILMINIGQID